MYTTNAIEARNAQNAMRTLDVGAPAAKAAQPVSTLGAQQNDLLRALSREDLMLLFEQLEFVKLGAGQRLYECGDQIDYAYFPTNAIISLHALDRANCDAVVQAAGYGYRLKTEALRAAFNEGGALAQQLMRYSSAMFAQLAQNVVGSRHSSIEQKLCRWLLDRLDRSMTNELKVTQETIAQMLGVRRESITGAAGKLQEEGMIECRRGLVVVLDRPRLESYAGTCYRAGRSAALQLND